MTLSSSDNSEGSGALLPPLKPPRSRLRRVLFWICIALLILIILGLSIAAYVWVNRYALMEDIAIETLADEGIEAQLSINSCLLYTSPSPRDATLSRMPSSA